MEKGGRNPLFLFEVELELFVGDGFDFFPGRSDEGTEGAWGLLRIELVVFHPGGGPVAEHVKFVPGEAVPGFAFGFVSVVTDPGEGDGRIHGISPLD